MLADKYPQKFVYNRSAVQRRINEEYYLELYPHPY